ncbi:uncharacterized protein [Polyergus mexicanus]
MRGINHRRSEREKELPTDETSLSYKVADFLRKKFRQGRASKHQIEALVTYLEQHPHLASGKFTTLNTHQKLQSDWEELAKYLNALQVPNGKEKDVKSWKTTWRDHKSKVSEKVQKLRKVRVSTGDNSIDTNLTELDKRILGIIGYEYVQDFTNVSDSCNVSDSLPEEHNPQQMKILTKEYIRMKIHDIRESFEVIADKHADAMKMLAEAIKLQAEATLQISNAIDKMTKNEERQTKLLEFICENLKDKNT